MSAKTIVFIFEILQFTVFRLTRVEKIKVVTKNDIPLSKKSYTFIFEIPLFVWNS